MRPITSAGPNADPQVADGVVHFCEVQLSTERLLRAKEQGHVAYEQIRSNMQEISQSSGQMESVQRAVVSELDAPRPLGGYFGSLRTVRAASVVRVAATCNAFLRKQECKNRIAPHHSFCGCSG